jgi:hypothetical protein
VDKKMSQIRSAARILVSQTKAEGRVLHEINADAIVIEFEQGKLFSLLEWINSVEKRLQMCGCRLYIDEGKGECRRD